MNWPRHLAIFVCLTTLCHEVCGQGPPQLRMIRVGGLFADNEKRPIQEAVFTHAIENVNSDRSVLLKARLIQSMESVTPGNSIKASRDVCKLWQNGMAAIFGPSESPAMASHIQSMARVFHMPHMETRYDYNFERSDFSLNIHPHPSVLGKAYVDFIRTAGWKSLVIVYQDERSLVKLQEIISMAKNFDDIKISLRQLYPDTNDQRPLFKEIKKSGETRIVLDCEFQYIEYLLEQAEEVGIVNDYHNYLITSLDLERLDLSPYRYNNVNITGFRMVDPTNPAVEEYTKKWSFGSNKGIEHPLYSENALLYDAVRLFAKAMDDLTAIEGIAFNPINCNQPQLPWMGGDKVLNYIKGAEYEGVTGMIQFDLNGFRTNVQLDLLEKHMAKLEKTAIWAPGIGVNYTRTAAEAEAQNVDKLQNKTMRVTTTTTIPFVIKKKLDVEDAVLERLSFEEKYEGYVVDFVKYLAEEVKFKYKFHIVGDGNYGGKNPDTGEWNGMIRELLDQKADMAVIDLSITTSRQEAVDFAMPFMNTGVGILYKKKAPPPPNLFSFLKPLSVDVWIYMITAYLATSILMFLLGRLSPYEWDNPHPCKADPDELETMFNMQNSLWFGIGSFLCQGSDILPKAISTRTVASMWWFFTLIMISSYTANLAAFLTAAQMKVPINSADDLAKQTKIKYGTYHSGSTNAFFQSSNIPTYEKLNAFMESAKPTVYTGGNAEGIDRVRKEDGLYAFFMEAAAIEYHTERICDLTQIGGLLDRKGYGVALPPGSPYTKAISDGTLALQEKGILQQLKHKWWKEMHGAGNCIDTGGDASGQLGLPNLGGVFIVLFGGMIMSCIIAVGEFMWNARQTIKDPEGSALQDFWKELKFAVDFRAGDSKPVKNDGPGSSGPSKHSGLDEEHAYGEIEDKDFKSGKSSSYAHFGDNFSSKSSKK